MLSSFRVLQIALTIVIVLPALVSNSSLAVHKELNTSSVVRGDSSFMGHQNVLVPSRKGQETIEINRAVTMDVLTSVSVNPLPTGPNGGTSLQFEQVSLGPGESVEGQTNDSVHLIYAVDGNLVIEATESLEIKEGSETLVPDGVSYSLQNDSGRCVSAMRLTALGTSQGGGFDSNVSGPALPASDCSSTEQDTQDVYWSIHGSVPTLATLFIARVTVKPMGDVGWYHMHSTRIALQIESGMLRSESSDQAHFLAPGSVKLTSGGTEFVVGDEPCIMLVVGFAVGDEPISGTAFTPELAPVG